MDKDLINRINETGNRVEKLEKQKFYEFWDMVLQCASILKEIHPNKRKIWLQEVTNDLYQDQDGLCTLCDCYLDIDSMQVDHIIPFSHGGGNEFTNIQLLCSKCNNHKGAKVDSWDLLKYLESRYMNLSFNERNKLSNY